MTLAASFGSASSFGIFLLSCGGLVATSRLRMGHYSRSLVLLLSVGAEHLGHEFIFGSYFNIF